MYALVDRTVPIEVARVQSLSKDLVDETAVTFAAASPEAFGIELSLTRALREHRPVAKTRFCGLTALSGRPMP
jgi:hypothetical protein